MADVKSASFFDEFDDLEPAPPDSDVRHFESATTYDGAGPNGSYAWTETVRLALTYRYGDESGDLVVTDPNVVQALKLYSPVQTAIESLLHIGARATIAASLGFDVDTHRREMQRAVEATANAFETIQFKVADAVGTDGPLAATMAKARAELVGEMHNIFAGQVDPDASDSLISRLQSIVTSAEGAWTKRRGELVEEWRRTTDGQVERIERVVRDMRDVDPASALGREFATLRSALEHLKAELVAARASSAERQRSTAKGADYESQVTTALTEVAAIHGDRASWTGSQQGVALSNRSQAKRGDVTCEIKGRDGLKIVAECMDRANPTESAVIEELRAAMANRGAQAAIAVCSSAENKLMGGAMFKSLGENLWAVVLQGEDPWTLPLQLAYCVARETVIATADRAAPMDLAVIESALEELQRELAGLQTMHTHLTSIRTARDNLEVGLSKCEGKLRAILARALAAIAATKPVA